MLFFRGNENPVAEEKDCAEGHLMKIETQTAQNKPEDVLSYYDDENSSTGVSHWRYPLGPSMPPGKVNSYNETVVEQTSTAWRN